VNAPEMTRVSRFGAVTVRKRMARTAPLVVTGGFPIVAESGYPVAEASVTGGAKVMNDWGRR